MRMVMQIITAGIMIPGLLSAGSSDATQQVVVVK